MSDLTLTEQKHTRTALRALRLQVGAWKALADALHIAPDTIEKVINGRRAVSAAVAFRVARLAGVAVDDLLAGRYVPGACPHCGHMPDFADESTIVEDRPPPDLSASAPRRGLKLVK